MVPYLPFLERSRKDPTFLETRRKGRRREGKKTIFFLFPTLKILPGDLGLVGTEGTG